MTEGSGSGAGFGSVNLTNGSGWPKNSMRKGKDPGPGSVPVINGSPTMLPTNPKRWINKKSYMYRVHHGE
jgi:hypothetical protein